MLTVLPHLVVLLSFAAAAGPDPEAVFHHVHQVDASGGSDEVLSDEALDRAIDLRNLVDHEGRRYVLEFDFAHDSGDGAFRGASCMDGIGACP